MNLTQSLKSSLVLVSHRKGLEKAEALLSFYEKACTIANSRKHQADQFNDYGMYKISDHWANRSRSAERAAQRIARAYHNQIAEIYQTPLVCNR